MAVMPTACQVAVWQNADVDTVQQASRCAAEPVCCMVLASMLHLCIRWLLHKGLQTPPVTVVKHRHWHISRCSVWQSAMHSKVS